MERHNGLDVCPKCGWYGGYLHEELCSPKLGAVADKLSKRFPGVKSTKLGYGHGMLTFEFSEDLHLRFRVNEDGTFGVEDLFWIGQQSAKTATALVQALLEMK